MTKCKSHPIASIAVMAGVFLLCFLSEYINLLPKLKSSSYSDSQQYQNTDLNFMPRQIISSNETIFENFCSTVQAKLCSIPECVLQSFLKLPDKTLQSIKNSSFLKIVHRHGTRISFTSKLKKSCGRRYAPESLTNSKLFKNYSSVFQFTDRTEKTRDGICSHSMLTGHGALQLYENGKIFQNLYPNKTFKYKSSNYGRTVGSLVSFAVGYNDHKKNWLDDLEIDIRQKYGQKMPVECSQIVNLHENKRDERDYLKFQERKHAIKHMGLCDTETYKTVTSQLSDICHETQTSLSDSMTKKIFNSKIPTASDRFPKHCNDTNYFTRHNFMTKHCSRDISIIRQYFILKNLINAKNNNVFWALHDVNLEDLWCIFFSGLDENVCPPTISYAAFMLFTDSSVIFSNLNTISTATLDFSSIKFRHNDIINQIKSKPTCKNLMKQFL